MDVSQFLGNGITASIKDNTTNKETVLDGDSTIISFNTSNTNAAGFANRYSLIFSGSLLPIKDISLTATRLEANLVNVKWSVIGQCNVSSYSVERSIDGTIYTNLETVAAPSASNYSFVDESDVLIKHASTYAVVSVATFAVYCST